MIGRLWAIRALRGLGFAAVLGGVLAGCSAERPSGGDLPLRNPTAPVASQADATLARMSGRWLVVESSRDRAGDDAEITPDALRIGARRLEIVAMGAGRFRSGDEVIWAHWLDADNRTLALGDPHGGWFAILDRSGKPGDRLRAARDILEWYGYDLSRVMADTGTQQTSTQ